MGITAEEQKGHTYYRCTKKSAARCSQPFVREEVLAADLSEILTHYAMPEDWTQGLLALADEDEKDGSPPQTTATLIHGLRERISVFNSKIERLTDLFVEQDIDRETYLAKKRGLMSEKKSVEEVLAKSQRGGSPWLEPMREWIKDASTLDEIDRKSVV